MSEPTAHATTHPVPGGTEVDVTITVPTPAQEVHPETAVVPAASPEVAPAPAGLYVSGGLGDTLVVSPVPDTKQVGASEPTTPSTTNPAGPEPVPNQPAPDATEPTPPTASGHPGDTPTTTAGEAGNAVVVRPDDPNATPTPAGDLAPSTPVIPADTPKEVRPDPTANDLVVLFGEDANGQHMAEGLLAEFDAHGFRVVWK